MGWTFIVIGAVGFITGFIFLIRMPYLFEKQQLELQRHLETEWERKQ